MKRFWVECCWDGVWSRVAFAESNAVQYCHGWLDCAESVLPHRTYRLCKRTSSGEVKVLREVKSSPPVHTK